MLFIQAGKDYNNSTTGFVFFLSKTPFVSYFYHFINSRLDRFMKWRYIISCLILIYSQRLFSQDFYLSNIGTEQGLPSTETYQTLQDSKGYIWITTDAGLCRYDGKKITTYTTKDGISENVIFWIREDNRGRVWFNTLSGFFFYYDYADNNFHEIAANPQLKKICERYLIHSFFIGVRDTLYCFAASHHRIIKIPPQSNYKDVLFTDIKNCDRYIYQNPLKKEEFVTTFNNCERCDKDTFCLYYNQKYTKVLRSKDVSPVSINNLTFTGLNSQGNLYLFDHSNLINYHISTGKITYKKFSSNLNTLNTDKDGDLWISLGNEGGLFYKKGDLDSKPIKFLNGMHVSNFMTDREGTIWINTLQKGVFRVLNKHILNIPLINDHVADIFKGSSGLHIGLSSKSEISVRSQGKESILITKKNNIPTKASLRSLYVTPYYSLYSTSSDLYYTKDNHSFSVVNQKKIKLPVIAAKQIIRFNQDTAIAICATGKLYFIKQNEVIKSCMLEYDMNTIKRLRDRRIITGTRNNNGLYEFRNDTLVPYLKEFNDLKTRINAIAEDDNSNLWIATNEKGLFCYTKEKLFGFNQKNGLKSDKINSIDIDAAGRIWLGTASGISCLNPENNINNSTIFNFEKSSGLPNLEVQKVIAFNNNIWCATKENLFYFNADKLSINFVPPYISINAVTVNNNPVTLLKEPVFKYYQNNLSVSFDALTFKNTEHKEFIYQLQGYDTAWQQTNTGEIQYTNLPANNYVFKVYSVNNHHIKSILPATYKFTVLKPFWLTWWFVSVAICALITIVIFFINWRTNKIKNREYLKTQFNKQIAEFHLTAVRAQMNPHFLFNAISSIQHYILSNEIFKSYDYLAKFSLLIRNVLDNSQEEYILIDKEIETLKLYIELEQIRFEEPFAYDIHVEEKLSTQSIYIPTMLIQPYIENAIWHGLMPKKKNCFLHLHFKQTGNNIEVIVKDNGVGRNSDKPKGNKQHASKGMLLTEQRLHALGIKTDADFSMHIIDLKDESNTPCGTEVRLSMPLMCD